MENYVELMNGKVSACLVFAAAAAAGFDEVFEVLLAVVIRELIARLYIFDGVHEDALAVVLGFAVWLA